MIRLPTLMPRWLLVLIVLSIGLGPGMAYAAPTPAQVEDAIAKGLAFIRAQQGPDGNYEKPYDPKDVHWGGITALATYALLAAGDKPNQPHIQKAVKFLIGSKIIGIYPISVRAELWQYMDLTPEMRAAMYADFTMLTKGQRTKGEARGLYHYDVNDYEDYDHSVSQFAVLGMWSMERAGAIIPGKFWTASDAAWRKHQLADGSWCYRNGSQDPTEAKPLVSMTAAGVATLFLTDDFLHAGDAVTPHGNIQDKNIEAGLKWLGEHFDNFKTDDRSNNMYYTLYDIERNGVASGRKYLGTHAWFSEGADYVLAHQKPDGHWGDNEWDLYNKNYKYVADTAFAVLFLVRGRNPVMMNKLQYNTVAADGKTEEGLWNQRPRDLANLSRWAGEQVEQELNWQITPTSAPPEDLHDAPILYISGSKPLNFSKDDQDHLRRFVQEGGVLFANADAANEAFAKSFRDLGKQLFPDYEFRTLPADHCLLKSQQFPDDRRHPFPPVEGLSNGVRELMLMVPGVDAARIWQTRVTSNHPEYWQLASDIYLYATDTQFMLRNQTWLIAKDPKITATQQIKLARLSYTGNWNPEPAGWDRLAADMHNQFKTDVTVEPVKLGEGKLKDYKFAHLTGTDTLILGSKELGEITDFLNHGGTLIVDAAGGSFNFAESAQRSIGSLVLGGAAALQDPLPPEHEMFSASGKPVIVEYRRHARQILGNGLKTPRLRAIPIDKRLAVFFSMEDLSAGLVGQPTDGINGYTAKCATTLMEDLLLYAAGIKPAPPAPPAAPPDHH